MIGLGLASALVVTMTACSSASTAGSSSGKSKQDTSAACGAIPKLKTTGTADLGGLPKNIQDEYAGYFTDVNASKYGSFVSKKTSGFTIGYSDSFSANSWRGDVLAQLNAGVASVKSSGQITNLIATNSNLDNNLQIQQITSMINQKVDAIIAIPGSPTAFDSVIKQAFDAGIPFITLASHVDSPYAINIDENYFGVGVDVAAGLANLMSHKGSVVIVDGINGAPASKALHDGYTAGFSNCPNISVAGSVEGQWSEAVTKTSMLQYLATNPGQIDGVINGGGETLGVIQALQQSSKKLVPIGDSNPDKGSLVSLKKNLPDKYVASTLPPVAMANAGLLVALGTLLGYQPKFDAIVGNPGVFTGAKTLDSWIQPGWLETDSTQAPAPPGAEFLPQTELPSFFAKPGPLPSLPE
ncbi:MAG: ribose transport system substrate-binding protein [Microbacteriaceae bacterium]|jgi:ribose transport system substrate-binding protein|nr:ribose transport system substrate-binding protein [Microbacteriaceae bacterium]